MRGVFAAGIHSNWMASAFANPVNLARLPPGARHKGYAMGPTVFQDWRRECEAVQKEINRLISAGRPQSAEERLVRQLQFTALIERRDAAARELLSASPQRKSKVKQLAVEAPADSPAQSS
jgi:hypothetical protein